MVIVNDNEDGIYTVSGKGTIIGSCALDCDTGYWECIVGENPEELQLGIRRYIKQVIIIFLYSLNHTSLVLHPSFYFTHFQSNYHVFPFAISFFYRTI